MIDAHDAINAGLASDRRIRRASCSRKPTRFAAELSTRACSTIKATKAMLIRLRDHRRPPAGIADDIVRECYGSAEFREGVTAFLDGRKPNWY